MATAGGWVVAKDAHVAVSITVLVKQVYNIDIVIPLKFVF